VGSGAAVAGVAVHFLLWPWRPNRFGVPMLTEAEGLPAAALPVYNAVLHAWLAASVLSIIREVPSRDRKWALVGVASLPVLALSARHHFTWLHEEAADRPAWWNRGAAGATSVTVRDLASMSAQVGDEQRRHDRRDPRTPGR
jgi:hypothetical protein